MSGTGAGNKIRGVKNRNKGKNQRGAGPYGGGKSRKEKVDYRMFKSGQQDKRSLYRLKVKSDFAVNEGSSIKIEQRGDSGLVNDFQLFRVRDISANVDLKWTSLENGAAIVHGVKGGNQIEISLEEPFPNQYEITECEMRKLSQGYPHPVLGIDNDILGDFNVRVEINYQEIEKVLAITLSYELINSDLESPVHANKAEFVATVYCPSTMTTWTTNTASIFVPKDALRDKFVLSAVIVANDRIVEYSSDTFADIFEGLSFTVEKGGVLADGGQQSFWMI